MESNFSEKQRLYYDRHARKFDKRVLYSRKNRNHYKKINRVINVAHKLRPEKVLEVGTGTGLHAYWFLKNIKYKVKFTGIDISENMLKEARKRLSTFRNEKIVSLKKANALSLPFKDEVFDLVFSSGTLHHIDRPEKAIEEMTRVLKKGGTLIIIEPNWLFPTNILAGLINPIEKNMLKMKRKNFFLWTKELLSDVKIENFLYTPPFPKRLIPIFDKLDDLLGKVPIINSISIMLYLCGEK